MSQNKLNLIRPIAFFDLETTGTDVEKDFIVSINIIKIMPGGEVEKKGALLNPGIPIPEGASSVHGITDQMVKDAPTFKQYSRGILGFLDGCDLGGFNLLKFDVPLLFNEFERSGISWDLSTIHIVDAGNIYKIQEPRTLSAAYKFYTGHVLEDAHEAEADNMATIEVFMAQLAMFQTSRQTSLNWRNFQTLERNGRMSEVNFLLMQTGIIFSISERT